MKLQHLTGDTYAIATDTSSIGLYLFDDQHCLLIDSGANRTQGQELYELIRQKGFIVHAIFNTHSHSDHCGGNHYIQSNSNCDIYASEFETAFIQQPILLPYTLYGAYPLKLLQSKFFYPQASRVSNVIREGCMPIKGQVFEVLELGGHTPGHLGIRTPDDVFFAGDSLISETLLQANPFLYLADPHQQMLTLKKIKEANFTCLYPSHGGLAADIPALIKANYEMMMDILQLLLQIIAVPRSREEIMDEVITRQVLPINRNHYFRLWASVSAFLAYLCNNSQATVSINHNHLLFCVK